MGKGYTWFCSIIAGFGSMLYGMDNVVIASTFAQPGFLNKFHPSPTLLGAIVSSFYGGTLLGVVSVFLFADRFSRKGTIQAGAAVGLIGAILQSVSYKIALFTAARVLTGFAAGIMLTTVQIYQAEIAPPQVRGRVISFQLAMVNCTSLSIALIGYGTYHSSNPNVQWRLPIALQALPAVGLCIGCFFIPYSPRWLVMHGRHEEARMVLKRLHDDNADHTFWEKEYAVIVAQIEYERQETKGASFFHMFTHKKELVRGCLAVAALTSTQTTGAQVILVFQSVIYSSLGYGTSKQLLFACIFQLLLVVGTFVNLALIDRVGRRFLFLSGLVGLSIVLSGFMVCEAYFTKVGSTAWGKAGIAMVMIFIFIAGCTFVSTGYAYASEVLPTKIRAHGMAFGMFSAFSMVLMFGQVTPIAFAAVGYKYTILFVCCNIFWFIIIYFFCPETKNLSLEEINALFGEVVVERLDHISDDVAHEKAEAVVTVTHQESQV